eukprot:Unigene16276_Nuclearia_a/m.48278 Unigene16276_Nuclearia_a/g.48278  ORF Unigene16276_Nuclearia_a/g.48278 Unigene16276_Nuclearia_a/m.48278 type:complete len:143 (-) Unigene16276_Nuclearia_a:317-745(-)
MLDDRKRLARLLERDADDAEDKDSYSDDDDDDSEDEEPHEDHDDEGEAVQQGGVEPRRRERCEGLLTHPLENGTELTFSEASKLIGNSKLPQLICRALGWRRYPRRATIDIFRSLQGNTARASMTELRGRVREDEVGPHETT